MTSGAEIRSPQLVEFSLWTAEALLTPAYKRARAAGARVIQTDDLLRQTARRSVAGLRHFGSLHDTELVDGSQAPKEPVTLPTTPDRSVNGYLAEAMLRDVSSNVVAASMRDSRPHPMWSRQIVGALAAALDKAGSENRNVVTQADVICGLLEAPDNRAAMLVVQAGLDRTEILRQVSATQEDSPRSLWTPAVDGLELLAILPLPALVRLWMWPFRFALRWRGGPRGPMLYVVEDEAKRQANRSGSSTVTLEHLFLAVVSIWHQLKVTARVADLKRVWPDGSAAAQGGITYESVVRRIVAGQLPELSGDAASQVTAVVSELSPAVAEVLERARKHEGASFVMESILELAGDQTRAIIERFGGDAERIRQALLS